MKKFSYLAIAAAFAMVGFSSCEKEVVTSPLTVETTASANITGYVTADLDLQNAGNEAAPAGTQLYVEVNYSTINPAATNGKWADTVTVDANGQYSVAVPADANGITVTITPFPFEASQTQILDSYEKTITKSFTAAPVVLGITSGQLLTQNIAYADAALPISTEMVLVSGVIEANLTDSLPGEESVPDGTVVYFTATGWADSAVVADGEYSIEVPKGAWVTWEVEFEYVKRVWNTTDDMFENVEFEYTITGSNSFTAATTEDVDFSAGQGTDISEDPTYVTISGAAEAELDDTNAGLEEIPDGTKIYFQVAGLWYNYAVVDNGQYEIQVPYGENISVSIDADLQVVAGGSTTIVNFNNITPNFIWALTADDDTIDLTAF